jgi:PAS domain S-box-containing protein
VADGQDVAQDARAMGLIECSPIAAVVSDPHLPDNPLVAVNSAFETLTGYSRGEILGRNCRFLAGSETEPRLSEAIRTGIREQRPVLVEILNFKKDGTPFRNAVLVAPLFDAEDATRLRYFIGSQVELPEDAPGPALERRLRASEAVKALSRRQFEVLRLVSRGMRNKQIAYELGLAEKTVKMHRGITMEKLGVRTAADMIRLAVEAGI